MDEQNEIVRIKKIETLEGTYYYPQRRVWKRRLFSESGYIWETFFLVITKHTYAISENRFVEYDEVKYNQSILQHYKRIELAERDCKEYMRVNYGDEVIKVWSKE